MNLLKLLNLFLFFWSLGGGGGVGVGEGGYQTRFGIKNLLHMDLWITASSFFGPVEQITDSKHPIVFFFCPKHPIVFTSKMKSRLRPIVKNNKLDNFATICHMENACFVFDNSIQIASFEWKIQIHLQGPCVFWYQ